MSPRRVLLGAFVALVLGGAVLRATLGPPPARTHDPRQSSANTGPQGARALYLWLAEFGFPSRSFRDPLTSLGEEQHVLFLLEPSEAISVAHADSVFAWVARGGNLFVAPGHSTALEAALEEWVVLDFEMAEAASVPGDRIVPDGGERWRYREVNPASRGMFAYPVREVATTGNGRVGDPTGEHGILFERNGRGLVAEIYHGDGTIVVFPEGAMLTNRGLAKAQNVHLVASLLDEIPPGTEIWFDEYSHGARVAGSLLTYFARHRPGLFALALVLTAILAAQRWGRALVTRGDEGRRRRRPSEFVDALGALYARSRATGPAWAALARTARRLVRGEPTSLRPSTMLFSTAAGEVATRRLEAAIDEASSPPGEDDLLRLARSLAETLNSTENTLEGGAR